MKTVTPQEIGAAKGVGAVDENGAKKPIGVTVTDAATETAKLRQVIEADLIPALKDLIQQGKDLTAMNERKASEFMDYLRSDEYFQRLGEEMGTRERKS